MHDWKKTLLLQGSTIGDAIHNLDNSSMQVSIVVSDDNILIGTITDGDIRRGLINGLSLNSTINSIVQQDAFVAPVDITREAVLHVMRANKIQQIPVVDTNRRVVGLHLLNDKDQQVSSNHSMVIMAGGFGTRLQPQTKSCPKPLLKVSGKPMMEHIINQAISEGFREFIITTHYLAHMIKDYFGDGKSWGVKISYLQEEIPLGTAGGIARVKDKIIKPFVVTNGDILTNIRYADILRFHYQHQADATMAVRQYEWQHPFGVVEMAGIDIVGFNEKPISYNHINAGVYCISPDVIDELDKDVYCDMPDLFMRLKDSGKRVIAYPVHEPWLDVGDQETFKKADIIE